MPYNFSHFEKRAEETKDWLSKEFAAVRTGRATPALLDGLHIDSYGAKTAISHVASISVEDPKTLRISPWDASHVQEIEKVIQGSNLGVSVATDSQGVRVIFPELTEESRKTFVKLIKEKLEKAKISLKQEREKVWNDISDKQKNGEISEDDKFKLKDELQKKMDEVTKKLEEITAKKEEEVKTI